jgi:hypothetical protein
VLIRWDADGRHLTHYDDREEWFVLLAEGFGLPVGELAPPDRDALWGLVCAAHGAWEAAQK